MPTPPTFTKVNPADQPILYLVITSTTLPPWTLDEYAETRIAQRISMVSGVAQVQVLGSQKYAVHAQLDPHALAARQIGINEVEAALRALERQHAHRHHRRTAQGLHAAGHRTADQCRAIQVDDRHLSQRRAGAPRGARHGHRQRRGRADRLVVLHPGRRAARASRSASSASRAPTPSRSPTRVKALLPLFQRELPPSVHMDVLYDRSRHHSRVVPATCSSPWC